MFSPILWAKIIIVVMIGVNALMLQARLMPLYWGASLSFVSWWMAALFGVFSSNGVNVDFFNTGEFLPTFTGLLAIYIISVIVVAALLEVIRKKVYSV